MAVIVREAIEAGALGFSTVAHDRAHGDRRRAGARHVRGGGRAVRHRRGARRARHRRLRARARRRARRGPRRARSRDGVDAPAVGGDRAARSRSRSPQNDHDPDSWRRMLELVRRGRGRRRARAAAGRGPARHAAARAPDVPPVRVLPDVGAGRLLRRSPSGSPRCATPRLRRRLLAEVRRRDRRRCVQFLDPAQAFPLGDPPELRAATRAQHRRDARASAGPHRRRTCTTTC